MRRLAIAAMLLAGCGGAEPAVPTARMPAGRSYSVGEPKPLFGRAPLGKIPGRAMAYIDKGAVSVDLSGATRVNEFATAIDIEERDKIPWQERKSLVLIEKDSGAGYRITLYAADGLTWERTDTRPAGRWAEAKVKEISFAEPVK